MDSWPTQKISAYVFYKTLCIRNENVELSQWHLHQFSWKQNGIFKCAFRHFWNQFLNLNKLLRTIYINLSKTTHKNIFRLKSRLSLCTSRFHTLDFVIFQIVINPCVDVVIPSYCNVQFYFLNFSWFRDMVFDVQKSIF